MKLKECTWHNTQCHMKGKHNELNPHTHSAFLYLPTPLQMPSVPLLSCHPSSVSPLQTNDTLSLVLLFFQGVTLDPSSPAVCAIWRVHHHDRDLFPFVKRLMTTPTTHLGLMFCARSTLMRPPPSPHTLSPLYLPLPSHYFPPKLATQRLYSSIASLTLRNVQSTPPTGPYITQDSCPLCLQ